MSYTTHICTWLYAEFEGEESEYPQVAGTSSTPAFQAVYWRCVVVFFATSLRHNPDARHVLFTNTERLPTIDGFDISAFFERHGIAHRQVSFTYQPPPGYYPMWRNQFYVLDVIQEMVKVAAPEDALFLLDSDCVWVESAARMCKALRQYGLLTYDMHYPEEWAISGLSRLDMKDLYEEIEGQLMDEVPAYYGGEFFGALGADAKRLADHFEGLWQIQNQRFLAGQKKFNEEGYFLSYLYRQLGYMGGTANPFIRRIWTPLLSFHNVSPEDVHLSIWHVPSEKQTGLKRLFHRITDPADVFWHLLPGEPFRQHMGRFLGIPRRTPSKWVRDLAHGIKKKVIAILSNNK